MWNQLNTLKFKILFTITLVMISAGMIQSIEYYYKMNYMLDEDGRQMVNSFHRMFDSEMEVQVKALSMGLDLIVKNRELIKAFAEKDRETVKSMTVDFYDNILKKQYGIDQFQFHTPPATSFFRSHKPDQFGDDLSSFRKTVLDANASKAPVTGLEVGRAGPGIRVVYPVNYNGNHAGTIELGSTVDNILAVAGNALEADYAVGIYEEVFKKAKRFKNESTDVLKGNLLFYHFSGKTIPAIIAQIPLNDGTRIVTLGTKHYVTGTFPLEDHSGKMIGKVYVIKDITRIKESLTHSLFQMTLIMAGFVVMLILVLYSMMSRIIIRPLKEAVRITNELAEGNLSIEIPLKGKDEMGHLLLSLKNMADKMNETLSLVSHVIVDVNLSVNEIADAVEKQASITTEQTASLSEITSTMEQLASSSSQIAEHTQSVFEIATNAQERTRTGAVSVEQVTTNMNEISTDNSNVLLEIVNLGKKSRDISKVMELINNVADQTKLIAFNAALEASSAGEAGKRFNIVAMEIRRLADSVMESTSEIEDKINEIQDAVNRMAISSEKGTRVIQEGLNTSEDTKKILVDIVEGSKATTDAAREISFSTQQQRTAAEQVVIALHEIEEGARQTSAAIKQTHGTSRNLAVLSNSLKEMVSKFKLSGKGKADRQD